MSTVLVLTGDMKKRGAPLSHAGTLKRPEPTLAELVKPFLGWFGSIRGRRPNTLLAYQKDLQAFVGFTGDHLDIDRPQQVTFSTVEMFMAHWLHREGKKASTVNRARYAIGSFFQFLRRQGLVASNPVADVFALKEPQRLPDHLSIPEQERLLAHLAASESLEGRRNYALVATALFCGLRVEELATARLDALDLEAGKLTVIGKGNKQRECDVYPRLRVILTGYLRDVRPKLMVLPIVGRIRRRPGRPGWYAVYTFNGRQIMRATDTEDEREARAVLADMVRDVAKAQESPYLFPKASLHGGHFDSHAGQPLLTRTIFQVIRRKVSPIVGRPVHPHMLRHSFASRLRENGAPLELIQEALGHADIKTTLIYAHLSTKKRREDIAKYLEGG